MGRISDEDVAKVREATDAVALISDRVQLQRKGRLMWGRCPFHEEKTPSFKVDPATQLWHCFGCGAGGDVFGFAMRAENLDFPEAVRVLADRARIEIREEGGTGVPRSQRERLVAACEATAAYYHKALTASHESGPAEARDYLKGRGFGIDVAKRFELGFAAGRGALVAYLTAAGFTDAELISANVALRSDDGGLRDRFFNRIMFPIRDLNGRCVGFGGRVLGAGEPKYLNTQETPVFHKSEQLYGIDKAKNAIVTAGQALVVEGYTDVIALHEAGARHAVATLGTALTRQHVRLLSRFAKTIVYLFDGDEAGLRAADRATEFIDSTITPEAGPSRVELLVAVIPDGRDPADLVGDKGRDELDRVVAQATPLLQFAIDRRLAHYDLARPEDRAAALGDAVAVLVPVRTSLLAHDYVNYIADRLMVSYDAVKHALVSAKDRPERSDDDTTSAAVEFSAIAVTPSIRAEREALRLMAVDHRLRQRACYLLENDLLTVGEHVALAEMFLEAGAVAGADLFARAQAVSPSLATLLTEMLVDENVSADAGLALTDVVTRLEEFKLERLIVSKKARLKSLDPVKDKAEYDELFQDVASLQIQVQKLRSGVSSINDTLEA